MGIGALGGGLAGRYAVGGRKSSNTILGTVHWSVLVQVLQANLDWSCYLLTINDRRLRSLVDLYLSTK